MSIKNYLFTSESVSEGHPDKVADRISDSVLDRFLLEDPHARVAVETMVTTNRIIIAGEVRGPESVTTKILEEAVLNPCHPSQRKKLCSWLWQRTLLTPSF